MVKRVGLVVLLITAGAAAFVLYRWYDRLPWLEAAVRLRAEMGSINCGHLSDSSDDPHTLNPDAVIRCALSAHQQHHPFIVIFSVSGVDEQLSTAIVGDSKGNAVELVYGTWTAKGTVAPVPANF
jgi:hypothetical protein